MGFFSCIQCRFYFCVSGVLVPWAGWAGVLGGVIGSHASLGAVGALSVFVSVFVSVCFCVGLCLCPFELRTPLCCEFAVVNWIDHLQLLAACNFFWLVLFGSAAWFSGRHACTLRFPEIMFFHHFLDCGSVAFMQHLRIYLRLTM